MQGKITLRAEDTKTKESRVLYLQGELLEVIHFQRALRDRKFPKCPWVFFDEAGKRIGEFRKSWKSALVQGGMGALECKQCGARIKVQKDLKAKKLLCPECNGKNFKWAGKIFHDFRRTAVRNMVRAGIPERVAMMVSGHKIRSIFERYNIVNEEDLKKASQRMKEYHIAAQGVQSENGHNLGTVEAERTQSQTEAVPAIH